MASMGSIQPYGHLIRSARTNITYVPRRTLTSTVIRYAQESNNDSNAPNNKPSPESQPQQPPSKPSALSSIKNFFFGGSKSDAPKPTIRPVTAPPKREGSLGTDSIFSEDEAGPKLITTGRTPTSRKTTSTSATGATADGKGPTEEERAAAAAQRTFAVEKRDRSMLQAVLDPKPRTRLRWEKKMVIREVRRRGRLTRAEQIMRTERESLVKSHFFKTSIKKLGPLCRQIAGKSIDEAILQMRLSKKKAAKDVLEHLKHAKNIAIVRSGMGLGAVVPKVEANEAEEAAPKKPTPQPVTITLKDGSKKTVTDPTAIYIDQVWVNRGPYGYEADHRARGVINMMRPPHTGMSVLLKEEATRIREWKEREARDLRRRKAQLWTPLPDRPITQQNQYYSW
ncbi:mitochondrial 54S ribosomal protein uL22m [Aspergillus brunneoviolaceus CBS 621.78]|uniref:Ribosomal protein L22 n=1 Tax=Aspergillus brunneoviolaceus CBS 621.78 TaxID=1450534 RepID=A0ACD1FZC5_9EURO|nr:ribosomal protein L22 [Aspergillus brunneoviolaceus CBS 621.78]RAH42308.1 ribosomal protein L22 [Aspergillus brunneoviolaceus CBS 621.78]